jgi:CheY-like chemotaxis protein
MNMSNMSPADAPTTAEPPPLRVLLVEDDADLAEATAEFLSLEGLDVHIAASGRDALEAASAFCPQLVLCDMNLPDISGLEVVRNLRANPSTEKAYLAILTAMRVDAKQPGVDAFISKPITDEVVHALRDVLTSRFTR